MKRLKNVAKLRSMLQEMERELGLCELRPVERDVLYAMHALSADQGEVVRSDAIKSHPLCDGIPPASFHRTLKTLISLGFVQPAPHRKTGAYLCVTAERA
ncbi:hypothetical protein [Anianabacter salinae]|uniref:hypothetical protein n=1 Tax=Anianabacter salinae TaxID=2851023 RepID=UPI00225E4789|nr:hypothetical protein [Anianabacter salinae]MBV0913939.1 hypothetical protein [Anianabacter salinae]